MIKMISIQFIVCGNKGDGRVKMDLSKNLVYVMEDKKV